MTIHVLVDYSFLYYKYKFQLESGKMRRLSTRMEWNGEVIEKDISQIYYSIREIESFRREWENQGHTVVMSVCFDMPPKRKQIETAEAVKYKSNRGGKLTEEDFENIRFVQSLLDQAGYNTYRITDFEADDIVNQILSLYKDKFGYNVIYTPDADLLVNICDCVGAKRYKTGKGYSAVILETFSDYLGTELKCNMPFNALMLYKCTVGDKSDCIDGIKKFGPAAFNKLVANFNTLGIDWSKCNDYNLVGHLLSMAAAYGFLSEDQYKQAKNSLDLVKPEFIPVELLPMPTKTSSEQLRAQAYLPYGMKSLV